MTSIFVIAEFLGVILLLALVFFIGVPSGLKAYKRWVDRKKPRDLSSIVIIAFFVLYLAAVAAISLISLSIKYDDVISRGVNREIIGAILLLFVYYFSIPKSVVFFRQWKLTKEDKPFSKMILSSVLTVYSFLIVFTIFIPKLIPILPK